MTREVFRTFSLITLACIVGYTLTQTPVLFLAGLLAGLGTFLYGAAIGLDR